jgi:hypothetical protein
LLNKPTYRFVHPNPSDTTKADEMWKIIHHLHSKDYPATLGCCREQPPDRWTTGHAYTLLGTHEVTNASGKSIKLCKVRNPWSSELWDGPWSDKSDLWTDDLKNQVGGHEDANDGVFFMEWEYVMRYGDVTTIAVDLDFANTQTWSVRQTT